MSGTLKIINRQVAHLEDHDWSAGVVPARVISGPIPPGNMEWPIIAVFVDEGAETGLAGINTAEKRETFVWTLASPLELSPLNETFEAHLLWRDEAIGLMRRAVDEYWGLPGEVTMTGIDLRWESALFEMPESGGVPFIVATSIKAGVDFREAF